MQNSWFVVLSSDASRTNRFLGTSISVFQLSLLSPCLWVRTASCWAAVTSTQHAGWDILPLKQQRWQRLGKQQRLNELCQDFCTVDFCFWRSRINVVTPICGLLPLLFLNTLGKTVFKGCSYGDSSSLYWGWGAADEEKYGTFSLRQVVWHLTKMPWSMWVREGRIAPLFLTRAKDSAELVTVLPKSRK